MAMAYSVFKPAQPLALRQLNRQYELERKNVLKRKRFKFKFSQRFKEGIENLLTDFGRVSTIHGMGRIFKENSNNYKRCFWIFTLISALIGTVYVCLILSKRYTAGSLKTIVDSTNKPVFLIPFPEITICNANHLNWDRLEEAKQHFMPFENNTERLRLFELVIGMYDNIKFGEFKVFKLLKNEPIELVKNINFSMVLDFMTWRCDEILTNCIWRHNTMNCCDIFSKVNGEGGICWNFNTLSNEEGRRKAKEDKKYPWRTGGFGLTSALTLRVLINEEKHFRTDNEKGITISVREPSVWYEKAFWVPANTVTVVQVDPIIYMYENDTRILTSSQRECVFKDERDSFYFKTLKGFCYMIENCLSQCRLEYMLRFCNCTVDFFFPPAEYRACQIKDFICLAENNDYLRFTDLPDEHKYVHNRFKGMECQCFRNCYSLNYATDVRHSFLPVYMRENKSYIDLDAHFRFETMMVYRTSLVFGWVDLMVAFGGIAGLFLGCSLISGMELIYFALVELPVFLYKEVRNKEKLKIQLQKKQQQPNNQRHFNPIPFKRRHLGFNNRIMAAQQFQKNDLSSFKNQFKQQNAKNEALLLWSQQYYLENKN